MSFNRLALTLTFTLVVAIGFGYVVLNDNASDTASAAPLETTTTLVPTTLPDPTTTTTQLPTTTTTRPATTTTTAPPTTTTTQATPTTTRPAPTTTAAPPPPTTAAPTTTAPPSGEFSSSAESDFAGRINSLRGDNGKSALTRDSNLNSYARNWSREMAEQGSLHHSNIGSLLGPWSAVGENIAVGGSVGQMFNGLVNSPDHYDNMLGEWTHFGVGVWIDGNGTLWTTHVFTR